MEIKKKMMTDLKHTIKDRDIENKVLLREIEELNVSVNERQHIHEAGSKLSHIIYVIFSRNMLSVASVAEHCPLCRS